MSILRVALPVPKRSFFDYLLPEALDYTKIIPGARVRVPFQSRTLVGIIQAIVETSEVPLKKIKQVIEVIDDEPILPKDVMQLCAWAADYYHYALGEVMHQAMPLFLRQGKPYSFTQTKKISAQNNKSQALALNEHQEKAVRAICESNQKFQTFLLDGVTGSGKTEVYFHVMHDLLLSGKQVLVLVPEINLTPQTLARFKSRFDVPIAALHSGLSDKDRMLTWQSAKEGDAQIVIGTRSAIFTPFKNLALIIVDEEHDHSFKQQDRFRYQARDLAVMRASMNHIPIVLGSATPSLETLWNVKRGRYKHLILTERAGNASLPDFIRVNIRHQKTKHGLSEPLLQAMEKTLEANQQVMLFLNRRGFAPVLLCQACAHIMSCNRCDGRLIYHEKPLHLACHRCDRQINYPKQCPSCQKTKFEAIGLGTQRLENFLEKHFQGIPLIRVDRDSTKRKNSLNELLTQIASEPRAILIGTQMLAKGHHFPRVATVGIVDADGGLFSAAFRATEHMGQLITQVAGRAGRVDQTGKVYIQTRYPDHPLLNLLLDENYRAFSEHIMAERKAAQFPPFSHFALCKAESHTTEKADNFLMQVKTICKPQGQAIMLQGPIDAMTPKKKGLHCRHLLIQSNNRTALQTFLKSMIKTIETFPARHLVKWVLDVDPIEVM